MDSARQSRPDVTVLVPAYNEVENIPELVQVLGALFDSHGLSGQIVLVDDGSTDGTWEEATRCAEDEPRLTVLRHRTNFGKTEAMLTGAEAATGEVIVLYDADMQHAPEDIARFVEKMRQGYDMVCGRKVGHYTKRFVSSIYNRLSQMLFKVPVHDLNSMKAFRREVIEAVHLRHDWHRFFAVFAHYKGFRLGEIDIELLPRRHGQAKYSGHWRVMIGLLDLLSVKMMLGFGRKPMTLFGTAGLGLLFCGFVTGLVALYYRIVLLHGYRPLLYLVILFVLAGVLLFSLGFLTELIGQLLERLERIERRQRRSGE